MDRVRVQTPSIRIEMNHHSSVVINITYIPFPFLFCRRANLLQSLYNMCKVILIQSYWIRNEEDAYDRLQGKSAIWQNKTKRNRITNPNPNPMHFLFCPTGQRNWKSRSHRIKKRNITKWCDITSWQGTPVWLLCVLVRERKRGCLRVGEGRM